MNLGTTDYAALDQQAYIRPQVGSAVVINGKLYVPIAYADNPRSGFQATAYNHLNADVSHEVVFAYRGTENGGPRKLDGVRDDLVDAGMVLGGLNAQVPDAMAFTHRVMQEAIELGREKGYAVSFTATGHSLGGTLAQIIAYEYGLRGETFNAYGAAGLMRGIPEGGHLVINHVRATDVVSAASHHFGEVRVYATAHDIDALGRAGYTDIPLLNILPSIHAPLLGKIQAEAHGIANFVPDPANGGHSLLAPQNEARYREHAVMVRAYRNDIGHARAATSLLAEAAAQPAVNMLAFGLGETGRAVQTARHLGQDIAQGVRHLERRGEAAGQAMADRFEAFAARLDRMLVAADTGDWGSFRHDTQAMALSDKGQALRAHAMAVVDQPPWQSVAPSVPPPILDAGGPVPGR